MGLNSVLIFLLVPLFVFEVKAQENLESGMESLREAPVARSSTANFQEILNSEAKASLEGLMEGNPEIRSLYEGYQSVWLSEPALAAYFSLGIGLITKLYLNWMKETRIIEEQSLRWLARFNSLKVQMAEKNPHATALEIEFLTMKNMEGERSSPSQCHSCGHHHHHHDSSDHKHQHSHNPKWVGAENIEADLLKWMRVIGELGSIGNSAPPIRIDGSQFSYLKIKKGMTSSLQHLLDSKGMEPAPLGPWTESIVNIFSKQIDQHLEVLKTDFDSLEKLKYDFGQSPLWKLNERKKEFFSKHDQLIKNFFMGFLRLVIQSGKILVWDYTAKPVYETFRAPRQKLSPLFVQGRVSRSEKGRINSMIVNSMGAGLFITYEMILHGILHIHTFCNHSLNLSLAMATSGFIHDILRQPFRVYSLLPKHLTLAQRVKFNFSIALDRWHESRLRAGIRWIHPETGEALEYSRKSFWNHYGHNMAHSDHFAKMLFDSSLWGLASTRFLDQMWESQSEGRSLSSERISSFQTDSPILEQEIRNLFSPSLGGDRKHQLVIDLLSGFRLYSDSLYHTLSQMAFLTRFDPVSLKKAQTILGKIKANRLRVEEILLIISKLPFSKTESIFGGPGTLIEILKAMKTQLNSLGGEVMDIYQKSSEFPKVSKSQQAVKLIEGFWTHPSERPPELREIIRNLENLEREISLQTSKLKALRRRGEHRPETNLRPPHCNRIFSNR